MSRSAEIETTSENRFDAQTARKDNPQKYCQIYKAKSLDHDIYVTVTSKQYEVIDSVTLNKYPNFEAYCANDSGFCEPEHLANKSYCYENGHIAQTESLRKNSTEARTLSTEADDQENDQHSKEEYPVPKSSSTPSRVEIFIDENWKKVNEETDTARYDENTPPEIKPWHIESQSRKQYNARRKRTREEQTLRESNNINCKIELFGGNDKETKLTESREGDIKLNIKTEDNNCVVADPLRELLVFGNKLEPEKGKKGTNTEANDISEKILQIPAKNSDNVSDKIRANLSGDIAEDGLHTNGDKTFRKKGRKSKTPRRSPTKCDPRFKGVTVWLQTEYKEGRSRLNISAFYSNVKALFSDRPRRSLFGNHVFTCSPDPYSFSETEDSSTPPYGRETYLLVKTCASCHTRRTPLWRDAEDGTPLCNACGIRYKKYRLRCSRCWHIPKKDIKTYPNCPTCGASLRYVFTRRTW